MSKNKRAKQNVIEFPSVDQQISVSGTYISPFSSFYGQIVKSLEEYNPTWSDLTTRLEEIEKMKNNGTIAGAINTYRSAIMACISGYSIQAPEDATPDAIKATDFFKRIFESMSRSLVEISESNVEFPFIGFSTAEKIWGRDSDGLYYISDLKEISQNSIRGWNYSDDGSQRLISIAQSDPSNFKITPIIIPIEKLVLFIHRLRGVDYTGQSILRAAYPHWKMIDESYKQIRINLKSNAMPTTVVKLPQGNMSNNDKSKIDDYGKSTQKERVTNGYLTVPYGTEVSVLYNTNFDEVPMQFIEHNDLAIMRALQNEMTADFGGSSGSQARYGGALGKFDRGVNQIAQYMREIYQEELINKVIEINFPNLRDQWEMYPRLVFPDANPKDTKALAETLGILSEKQLITVSLETEEWIRDQEGLPPMSDEEKQIRLSKNNQSNQPVSNAGQPVDNSNIIDNTTDGTVALDSSGVSLDTGKEEGGAAAKTKSMGGAMPMNGYDSPHTDVYGHDWWRPLTSYEKICSLNQMIAHFDDKSNQIVSVLDGEIKDLVTLIIEKAQKAFDEQKAGNEEARDNIAVDDSDYTDISELISQEMMGSYQYGMDTVQEERRRQLAISDRKGMKSSGTGILRKLKKVSESTKADKKPKYYDPKLAQKYADQKAYEVTKDSVDRMARIARNSVATQRGSDSLNTEELQQELYDLRTKTFATELNAAIITVFGYGRLEQADVLQDQVKEAEYSAIMDDRTCEICNASDGATVEVGSNQYDELSQFPKNCLGGDNCRCIWVYVFAGI